MLVHVGGIHCADAVQIPTYITHILTQRSLLKVFHGKMGTGMLVKHYWGHVLA